MTTLEVVGGAPLRGRLRVPGDKSISHRALLLGALAEGTSRVRGLSGGGDVRHTLAAIELLGAGVSLGAPRDGAAGPEVVIEGGRERLHEPAQVLDVGNSGTGMRLLAGLAASLPGLTVLQGDSSVASRPMERVALPLRAMGASVDGRGGGRLPPLAIRGGHLRGIEHTPSVASAQVKSAVLLAALAASGETVVREPVTTRRHTEELMAACGARLEVEESGGGQVVRLRPGPLAPLDLEVPGDPSQAAYWVVAACLTPGSDVVVEGVYVGEERAGFLGVLARMGARVELQRRSQGERVADIRARSGPLRPADVGGREVASLIDEVPVLAVAAAAAEGVSSFRDAAELRVKETDRIETIASELGALGAGVETLPDGLVVRGPLAARAGAWARSHGDHRIAMAAAVAALASEGTARIEGWEAVETSYPGFVDDLARLGGPGCGRLV